MPPRLNRFSASRPSPPSGGPWTEASADAKQEASAMRIIDCSHTEHAPAILEILNEAILNSTALYDYAPRTLANMSAWFETKQAKAFPVIGAVADDGTLLGFATYGSFRERPAYKYTVEHSVYVHTEQRGRGVGRALMQRLIERARQQDYHALIGGIDTANAVSIALHRALGFEHCGTVREAGFKFGRWLDLDFYQLLLETPRQPVDG